MPNDRRSRTIDALQPHIQRARAMSGWSPAGVVARHLDPGTPWDYEALARVPVARANTVLDMGTGDGNVLSRVAEGVAARIVATEEWVPSLPLAQRRLAPLAIDVLHARSVQLPFAAASFDAVINKHEELDPAEVARVLAPGGTVVTQQVGPDNWPELDQFFPRRHQFGDLFTTYRDGFETSGLIIITARQHRERVAFGSLGDVVYMLLVAPWDIPGFDPGADIEALLALEDAGGTVDGIVLTETRFVIEARKPS